MESSQQPSSEPQPPPSLPEGVAWAADLGEWELAMRDAQGERDGFVRTWRRDGTLASEAFYRAGRMHGVMRRFHPDGSLAREMTYVDGEPEGRMVAFGHEQPTPEPLQSCCVPPGAWRLETDYAGGLSTDIRWYDRSGVRILRNGEPYPPRPESVPARAGYDEIRGRWMLAQPATEGAQPHSVLRCWSIDGVLREREGYRDGHAEGLWQRFDDAGELTEEATLIDGRREGEARRQGGALAGVYADPRVREERGRYAQDQAVGLWSLRDAAGQTVAELDLGPATSDDALRSSPALGTDHEDGAAWVEVAGALERAGKLREAVLAQARAAAAERDVGPLRAFLVRRAPALTADASEALTKSATGREPISLVALVDALVRGGDAATLLRAIASALLVDRPRAALDLVDTAILLAPQHEEWRITRALANVILGHPREALQDAAVLPAGSEQRVFLDAYVHALFPPFGFAPAGVEIRALASDVPSAPTQPLPQIRSVIQKLATRITHLCAAVEARVSAPLGALRPSLEFSLPDVSALLPDGPVELAVWEFDEVIVDENGQPVEGGEHLVKVDERVAIGDDHALPFLMRLLRADWVALGWLCWSVGLDRPLLPDAINPPGDFGRAAAMAIERTWRLRDRLMTGGLRALHAGVPGFTWEGVDIDTLPRPIVEIAVQEHVELRALFYWLCDEGVQSPWQDNLRGQT